MYAAAGGASIANRRKQQKQLQNRRSDIPVVSAGPTTVSKIKNVPANSQSRKFSRPRVVPPQLPSSSTLSAPPASSAFHSSLDRHRCINARPQHHHHHHLHHHHHHHHHHYHHNHHHHDKHDYQHHHQLIPLSPIHFPISPPPLSLESPSPSKAHKTTDFPFPSLSILDLRVSPSTTELQCSGQAPNKTAWQGCNKTPHPLSPVSPHSSQDGYKTRQCEAHRRWMKRNRIRDASYCYGDSGEDDEEDESAAVIGRSGEMSAAGNTLLYAGLGTTALGLLISFVGTGEKGFLSPELRLIGPSLLCAGLLCCFLRVLLCLCFCRCGHCRCRPCPCVSNKKRKKHKEDISLMEPSLPIASLLSPPAQTTMPSSTYLVSSFTSGQELLLSPTQLHE